MTKTSRLRRRTCGSVDTPGIPHVQRRCSGPLHMSVQFRSAGRCTFENCTSCCPSRETTMVVSAKKKRSASTNTQLTTSRRGSFHGRTQSRRRNVLAVKTAVCGGQRVQQLPLSKAKDATTSCSVKKSPRPAWLPWPRSERGHHSFDQACAARPWISAIYRGGRHYFPPHKMAKKKSLIIVTLPL